MKKISTGPSFYDWFISFCLVLGAAAILFDAGYFIILYPEEFQYWFTVVMLCIFWICVLGAAIALISFFAEIIYEARNEP